MQVMDSFDIFLRNEVPTRDEWRALIEEHLSTVKSDIASYSLKRLGSAECLYVEHQMIGRAGSHAKVTAPDGITLDTECLIFMPAVRTFTKSPTGEHVTCGGRKHEDGSTNYGVLTKDGNLLLVVVDFTVHAWTPDFSNRERIQETATAVHISPIDPLNLCIQLDVGPVFLWSQLGDAIEAHAKKCQVMADQAIEKALQVRVGKAMYKKVCERMTGID